MTAQWHRGTRPSAGPSRDRYPPARRTLTRLLTDQAAARPDGVWLVFDGGERTLTYGQAYQQALQVARRLRHETDRPRVGIALRNCPELVLALHGTLLAGGTAYLLDPSLPPRARDRLRATLSLTTLVAGPEPAVAGRGWERWLAGSLAAGTGPEPRPAGDALVMFTSGSTGEPKGVVLSHHFAYLYSALVTDSLGRGPGEVLTTALPMFHASGLHMVAHSALHAGAVAHLYRRFSASRFFPDAARDRATQAALVPEMVRMIARRTTGPVPGHRLRFLLAGGMSDPAERAEVERRFGVRVRWQGYGMTEAYPVPMAPGPASPGPQALGVPVDLYAYRVRAADGTLLGPDQPGELVLAGTQRYAMFSRYLGQPRPVARPFRTGDLVRYDRDGVLHFAGRAAGRIRHRGEQVDPAEVEAAALGCPGVTGAAAYGVPSDLGDQDVKLDVTGSEPLDLAELHRQLRERLRSAAVPRYLEQRAALPRTASFRVRRAELRADGVDRPPVLDTGGL